MRKRPQKEGAREEQTSGALPSPRATFPPALSPKTRDEDLAALSGTASMYQITAASAQGQNPVTPVAIGQMPVSGSSLTLTLPAYSVTTIDVH